MNTRQTLQRRRPAFTLVELLIVILIIAVLAVLAFSVGRRTLDASHRTVSMGNLRQLGIGFVTYSSDNLGYLPLARRTGTSGYWPEILWPYLGKAEIYLRPGSVDKPLTPANPNGYFDLPAGSAKTPENLPIRWNIVINGGSPNLPFSEDPNNNQMFARGYSRRLDSITQPERLVLLGEGTAWWLNSEAKKGSSRLYRWGNGTTNILFADGSCRPLNPDTELTDQNFTVNP